MLTPDAKTKVYCILGNPVKHSLSPRMHNAAFQISGENAVYAAFETANLPDAVKGLKALGIAGASITIPHKIAVIPLLDEISETAKAIGSVNTIINQDGRLFGDNTDAYGFYQALSRKTEVNYRQAAVFGSGGSAKAVCFALFYFGNPEKVMLFARNHSAREELKSELLAGLDAVGKKIREDKIRCLSLEEWEENKSQVHILVNTTSLGMEPDNLSSILPAESIPSGITVMDIVYKPHETKLLKDAAARGCRTVFGIDMLLYQGIRQFELWTGKPAPKEAMLEALMQAVREMR